MATLLEMKNLTPTENIPVAEVEAHNPAQHGNLPVAQPGLTQAQIAALQPLENGITYLGVNRDTLEGLRTKHSMPIRISDEEQRSIIVLKPRNCVQASTSPTISGPLFHLETSLIHMRL